ncbi:MAG: hypothetical protein JWR33_543 [Naasia sp.]|jgi:cytochrome oxidase assembly protein ShyY1|uniref:SURF1 family cytochrome oxidase biogenesis protein n=1 Tax=Naasia sp. TaxID=2546198 RepID=UPI002605318B|nr:SURF1 family protein [Naasia sp.]MCU1569802.1 hypothetical protein [Naasia sp.]
MSGWRFVLSARWARYLLLAVIFALACAGLASWQLARRDEKVQEIRYIQQNYDSPPTPLAELLPERDDYSRADEWRPVVLTGSYQGEDQLLVRNRPKDGDGGFEVLVPFRTDQGAVFLIDRGWIPLASDGSSPSEAPPPPPGEVTVVARLKGGEPSLPGGTTASGILASIQLSEVERLLDEPIYSAAYGLLDSEDPAPPERPAAAVRPELDEGPHLSYALQWVIFALIGFGGLAFAIRQEYRYRNADEPEEQERAARRAQRRAAKPTDDDVEDALLDRR